MRPSSSSRASKCTQTPARHLPNAFTFAQRDGVPITVAFNGRLLSTGSTQTCTGCTLLTQRTFAADDTFDVHLRVVQRLGGGHVVFGVAPNDAAAHNASACAKSVPGKAELHESIGCSLSDHQVVTRRAGKIVCSRQRCNVVGDATEITMSLAHQQLSFAIDGEPCTPEVPCQQLELTPHKQWLRCQRGHSLVERWMESWICDRCEAAYTRCVATGCRLCDYDVCSSCVENETAGSAADRPHTYRIAVGLCGENQKVHCLRDEPWRWMDDQGSASTLSDAMRTVQSSCTVSFTQCTGRVVLGTSDVYAGLDIKRLAGSAVTFGVVDADTTTTGKCRSSAIGTAALPGSIGCQISQIGCINILCNGSLCFIDVLRVCDTATSVGMSISNGTLSFSIDNKQLRCDRLRRDASWQLDPGTHYRVGVTMNAPGQMATLISAEDVELSTTQQGTQPSSINRVALSARRVLARAAVGVPHRFVGGRVKSIASNATGNVACCVKAWVATCHTKSISTLVKDGAATFTVRLVSSNASVGNLVVGVLRDDVAADHHLNHSIGSATELKQSFGFSTLGSIYAGGARIGAFHPLPAAGETMTVSFGQTTVVSLHINEREIALPEVVQRLQLSETFRFGVTLSDKGHAVKIGNALLTEEEASFLTSRGVSVVAAARGRAPAPPPGVPAGSPHRGAIDRLGIDRIDDIIERYRIDARLVSFSRDHRLGGGAFGSVYRGTWDGEPVAIKEMNWEDNPRQRREILVGRSLSHPNIATIHGWYRQSGKLSIVMPLCADGTLGDMLHRIADTVPPVPEKGGPFGWSRFFTMTLGILRALRYMASRDCPVIHRDLKPANILMVDGLPQLADFGLAKEVTTLSRQTQAGTPIYMSPEQIAGSMQSPATDVYSFACIAWQLLMAPRAPRYHCQGLLAVVREVSEGRPLDTSRVPEPLRDAMSRCFDVHPERRPTSSELIDAFETASKHPKCRGG